MLSFLIISIKNFGFLNGLDVYFRLKIFRSNKIRLRGYSFPLFLRPKSSDIVTFREIFFRREYDIALPEKIKPHVIIDAGANIGFTTIFLLKKYPMAKIISLEPENENYELLRKNTEKYQKVTALKAALWNKSESIKISDQGWGVRGFIIEKESDKNATNIINSFSIEDIINKFNVVTIDILKIDIEGSEKEVFESNFESWLPKVRCLIIELHDRMKKDCSKTVFAAISKYNFDLTIRGENLVFINREL